MEKVSKVKIRIATEFDIPDILAVEEMAWPPGGAATKEMMTSRIRIFGEGVWVAVYQENIIGVVCFECIFVNQTEPQIGTWYSTTDNGFIKNSHKPNGNALFGIDLSVVPHAPYGVGSKLVRKVGEQVVLRNLKFGLLGGRLPGYHRYSKEYSPEDYIKLKNEQGELLDPEVRFYKKSGMQISKVIPNYFHDAESQDYGVLIVWRNPFYIRNYALGKKLGKLLSMLFRILR